MRDRGHLRSHKYCHMFGEVMNYLLLYALYSCTIWYFFSLQWSCMRKTAMISKGCSVEDCAVYFCCQALMYLCRGWISKNQYVSHVLYCCQTHLHYHTQLPCALLYSLLIYYLITEMWMIQHIFFCFCHFRWKQRGQFVCLDILVPGGVFDGACGLGGGASELCDLL